MRLAVAHESVARVVADANRAARNQLTDTFQPELKRAGREKSIVLDELELVTSWSSWEVLRTQLGASPERARRIMSHTMTTILWPHSED